MSHFQFTSTTIALDHAAAVRFRRLADDCCDPMVAAILLELADEYEAVAAAQKIGTITDGEARAGGDAIPGAGLRKRPGSLIGRTANLTAAVRGRIIAAAR